MAILPAVPRLLDKACHATPQACGETMRSRIRHDVVRQRSGAVATVFTMNSVPPADGVDIIRAHSIATGANTLRCRNWCSPGRLLFFRKRTFGASNSDASGALGYYSLPPKGEGGTSEYTLATIAPAGCHHRDLLASLYRPVGGRRALAADSAQSWQRSRGERGVRVERWVPGVPTGASRRKSGATKVRSKPTTLDRCQQMHRPTVANKR